MTNADLRGAITAYLADVGGIEDSARAFFGPSSWWGMKMCSARWLDFVNSTQEQGVPRDLAGIIAEIAGRLNPILEGS
jgi:hypothetical protein